VITEQAQVGQVLVNEVPVVRMFLIVITEAAEKLAGLDLQPGGQAARTKPGFLELDTVFRQRRR